MTVAALIRQPELWEADPVKLARRLAKWRTMPAWRRVRAMELMERLCEQGRITRL